MPENRGPPIRPGIGGPSPSLAVTMCSATNCDEPTVDQRVETGVPGTVAVTLSVCPACDTVQCRHPGCGTHQLSRYADKCPKGHRL